MTSALLFGSFFLLLAIGVPIGIALGAASLIAIAYIPFLNFDLYALGLVSGIDSFTLIAVVLFTLAGNIMSQGGISNRLVRVADLAFGRAPGDLGTVTIMACLFFAAISGTGSATVAAIGLAMIPALVARGYDRAYAGALTIASSVVGPIIPPSVVMIVYGVAAQVSINRLFIAGVVPGLMLMALFSGYIAIWSRMNPDGVPAPEDSIPLGERLRRLRLLLPVVGLIIGVIGSIYAGVATATEAAAIGVAGALLIALIGGTLNLSTFTASLMGATRTSAMIGLILLGAAFLTSAMSFSGLPAQLAEIISASGLGAPGLIAVLTVFFVLLGCFLDGISIVVLTTSVVMPAIAAVGVDPVWFGVYLIIVVEMAQITPPLGFNLFVIQNLTGRSIFEITRMIVPYFLILVLAVILLTAFPGIATWLVEQTL